MRRAHLDDFAYAARKVSVLVAVLVAGCAGQDAEGGETDAAQASSMPVVITADWLAGTLTYASYRKMGTASTRSEALLHDLDLSAYSPGPLALELTPDGKQLLVAVSAGFFSIGGGDLLVNAPDIPAGPGKLLIVDIDGQRVVAELETGDGPMGIAVTPDSKRAFVAHFNSGNMAVVDLEHRTIADNIEIGVFAEEVALDETGTVGIVGYSAAGSARTFNVADPKGSLSPEIPLQGDSAGVAFFPGTKIAFLVQAPNPLALIAGTVSSGHTLIDVSDGSAPRVLEDVRQPVIAAAYPAMAAPDRGTVLVPVAQDDTFTVHEFALEGQSATEVQSFPVGGGGYLSALGLAYDGDANVVLALPGQRALITANLDTHESHTIAWGQDLAGPADVVIRR